MSRDIVNDLRHLIAGAELTPECGERLINEIRMRIRQRPAPTELETRHEIIVAIADHRTLPDGARWEQNGVSYSYVTPAGNGTVWGQISYFEILDAVIDRRIAQALEFEWKIRP